MQIGCIETGGTKINYGIGNEKGEILQSHSMATANPKDNMQVLWDFYSKNKVDRIGIGSFGPIIINKNSPKYGEIQPTSCHTKSVWAGYNILSELKKNIDADIYLDTDVGAAAMGELIFGYDNMYDNLAYITVGTGVGVGIVINKKPISGLMHPEGGHMLVQRHIDDVPISACPFHDCCVEGLIAGGSLEKRYGIKSAQIPNSHICWDYFASYLGQLVVNTILFASPQKIIIGGGVIMRRKYLLDNTIKYVDKLLNSYIDVPTLAGESLNEYISLPKLGDNAGLCGAIALTLD